MRTFQGKHSGKHFQLPAQIFSFINDSKISISSNTLSADMHNTKRFTKQYPFANNHKWVSWNSNNWVYFPVHSIFDFHSPCSDISHPFPFGWYLLWPKKKISCCTHTFNISHWTKEHAPVATSKRKRFQ